MCILLKLDYAKFGVSNLCFQNLSRKNLWRGWGGREGEWGQLHLAKYVVLHTTVKRFLKAVPKN